MTPFLEDIRRIAPHPWDRVAPRLGAEDLTLAEAASLLTAEAGRHLEEMARAAHTLTQRRFGKTIRLYAPVYISNRCINGCRYCGFQREGPIERKTLTPAEAIAEARAITSAGHRHLLIVAGEDPKACPIELVEAVARAIRPLAAGLAVEVGPLDEAGYRRLSAAGVDGVTLYQETYDEATYALMHPFGPKSRFGSRLKAIDAAGRAGMRFLGIGALLGLSDWRREALALVAHARWLMKRHWRSGVAVSVPRIRDAAAGFQMPRPVSDAELSQMIVALRLALPDCGIVLSTREPAALRDRLLPLGVTQMSAGSSTRPGGYTGARRAGEQFPLEDARAPNAVARMLCERGYDPVWKDWDARLHGCPLTLSLSPQGERVRVRGGREKGIPMRHEWIAKRSSDAVKTQMHYARRGIVTEEMRHVAESERLDPELVRSEIARGRLIIPANAHHPHLSPIGIGACCRCKVNANIGNSAITSDRCGEMGKLTAALDAGADAVMDLSTGPDIDAIRRAIIAACPVPVGTVPLYEAAHLVDEIEALTVDALFEVIERHAEQGVDFITVHCGLLSRHVPLAAQRTTGIVSRGGALTARWMQRNGAENPLYEHYDRLLDICRRHDMSLSLGDGLRPGSLADASDAAQFAELETLGELVRRTRAAEVQAMVEGPGHVPFHEIGMNVKREIELCDGAPFYVLGPLVTDIAAGHDHIASAIGGTMAAFAGASMLCYVTPKEHLGLPDADDVRAGVIAHRIAAHAADVALGRPGARERDDALSRARYALDWEKQFELLLDPVMARRYWEESSLPSPRGGEGQGEGGEACSMCGPKFCALKISRDVSEKIHSS